MAAAHGFTSRQNIVPRRKGRVDGDLMGNFDFSEVWSKKSLSGNDFKGFAPFEEFCVGSDETDALDLKTPGKILIQV